ncbi:MAG: four helix bundle protein [Verrucomicrobia bacterium]|nr:four helix bundle protein [Verrucomicrobiota bacterium]
MGERRWDLEDRTEKFAADVRRFVRGLPRTVANLEDVRQLVRASGSVAANLVEANECLGTKDRVMRFRICRKEAKESGLWIRLLNVADENDLAAQQRALSQEAHELKLIMTAIIKQLE